MFLFAIVPWLAILVALPEGILWERHQSPSSRENAAALIKVVSARRADKYAEAGSTELTPRQPDSVILVVDIAGVSIEEFQRLQRTETARIFLAVGNERYESSRTISGAWREPDGSVKEERLILVVVPRNRLDFTLHFVDSPPVKFTADKVIVPKLP